MELLDNVIQPYAWGSRTALAELRGSASSERPEAELWMGAHPLAPSRVAGTSLLTRIEAAPDRELGGAVARAYGKLPYLLKVLAAEQPLSLQAHPDLARAREGFAQEDAAGVPRGAAHRNYKDDNHKPELICALGPFDALCGFRDHAATAELLRMVGLPELARQWVDDPRAAFRHLMTLGARVPEVVAACRAVDAAFAEERAWAVRLAALHPSDPGVIGALLLNLVHLAPGEALYLPAGNLHAYLHGVGVEIMASSDNVLRGGLTPKHVDVDELVRVLDFRAIEVEKLRAEPVPQRRGALEVYRTPAREFELSRATGDVELDVRAPIIVLCTEGTIAARDDDGALTLTRGQSAFVRGSCRTLALSGGTAYLATARV